VKKQKKVGLFFGSFNPIHTGHMIIANVMAETTDLHEVWFVVSPQNPHKKSKSLLHEFDRMDMVEAAIADNFCLKATDIEFQMPRPSYTVDTLAYLTDKYPNLDFKLIIGEDNLKTLHRWKNYKVIVDDFGLYVYPRPHMMDDHKVEEYKHSKGVRWVQSPSIDISATMIRRMIRSNQSIRYLVPDPVIALIELKKYYI